jgi:hypothetical protein
VLLFVVDVADGTAVMVVNVGLIVLMLLFLMLFVLLLFVLLFGVLQL